MPKHFAADSWCDLKMINVAVGKLAQSHTIVMLCKPGLTMDFTVSKVIKIVLAFWADR